MLCTLLNSTCSALALYNFASEIRVQARQVVKSARTTEDMLNLVGMCLAKVNEKLAIATWIILDPQLTSRGNFHEFSRYPMLFPGL